MTTESETEKAEGQRLDAVALKTLEYFHASGFDRDTTAQILCRALGRLVWTAGDESVQDGAMRQVWLGIQQYVEAGNRHDSVQPRH